MREYQNDTIETEEIMEEYKVPEYRRIADFITLTSFGSKIEEKLSFILDNEGDYYVFMRSIREDNRDKKIMAHNFLPDGCIRCSKRYGSSYMVNEEVVKLIDHIMIDHPYEIVLSRWYASVDYKGVPLSNTYLSFTGKSIEGENSVIIRYNRKIGSKNVCSTFVVDGDIKLNSLRRFFAR